MSFEDVELLLKTVSPNTHHFLAPKGTKSPWITWAQHSSSGSYAGDRRYSEVQYGVVDLFTLSDPEPLNAKIETALSEAEVVFDLVAVQKESDTGLYHYTWDIEVV